MTRGPAPEASQQEAASKETQQGTADPAVSGTGGSSLTDQETDCSAPGAHEPARSEPASPEEDHSQSRTASPGAQSKPAFRRIRIILAILLLAAMSVILYAVLTPLLKGSIETRPTLQSHFAQMVEAAGYPLQQTELCIITTGWEQISQCSRGAKADPDSTLRWEIPADTPEALGRWYSMVGEVDVQSGRITVKGKRDTELDGITYILTPEEGDFGRVIWKIDPASTCRKHGLC